MTTQQWPASLAEVHADVKRLDRYRWQVSIVYTDTRPDDWPAEVQWLALPHTWTERTRWGRRRADRTAHRLLARFLRHRMLTDQKHVVSARPDESSRVTDGC